MRKKRKLRVKKYYNGGATDTGDMGSEAANVASTAAGAASVGAGNSGPTDPGIAKDSITSLAGNYAARASVLGLGNVVPGATAYNAIGAMRDTAIGRQAMGMAPTIAFGSSNASGEQQEESRECPSGQVLENGNCVMKKLSNGGTVSLEKKLQLNYYKDLL